MTTATPPARAADALLEGLTEELVVRGLRRQEAGRATVWRRDDRPDPVQVRVRRRDGAARLSVHDGRRHRVRLDLTEPADAEVVLAVVDRCLGRPDAALPVIRAEPVETPTDEDAPLTAAREDWPPGAVQALEIMHGMAMELASARERAARAEAELASLKNRLLELEAGHNTRKRKFPVWGSGLAKR